MSTTIAVSEPRPDPPGVLHGFPVRALVELRVAKEAVDPTTGQGGTDRDAEPVSERAARDLDSRRELAIRVVAERRVERAEVVELVGGEEALGG